MRGASGLPGAGRALLIMITVALLVPQVFGSVDLAAASPLAERKADLTATKARLGRLQSELDGLAGSYAKAEARLYRLDDSVTELQKGIARTKTDLTTARSKAQARLTQLYKGRHGSVPAFLEALFEARDLSAVLDRVALLDRVASQDQTVFSQVEQHLARQKRLARQLDATRSDQAAKTKELAAARDRMESRISAASTEYRQLKAEVASLEKAQRDAQARLAAAGASARASVSSSRGSAGGGSAAVAVAVNGFVFPVAGSHSFINDWGFARSGGRTHQGTDIMASRGTPAVACVSGRIDRTNWDSGLGGTTIWLDGENGVSYYYAHLDSIAGGISPGTRVSAGQVIGAVGNSGNARGGACHLHFQMHPGGGGAVNPYFTLRASD